MANNKAIIRDFIRAWSGLDPEELASYFTEDGVYHNIPGQAARGRDNVKKLIEGFIGSWESTDWELVTMLSDGDTVVAERVDRSVVNGKKVDLPCVGIFHMENGKIKLWRDYFDMSTYTIALS